MTSQNYEPTPECNYAHLVSLEFPGGTVSGKKGKDVRVITSTTVVSVE